MNSNIDIKKRLRLLFVILIIIFTATLICFYDSTPDKLILMEGEEYIYNIRTPVKIYTEANSSGTLNLSGQIVRDKYKKDINSSVTISPYKKGYYDVKIKLFGVIPIKSFNVNVIPNIKVIPCGSTVGVKLYTEGVLVIGISKVVGKDGYEYYPWRQAKIKEGDSIEYINNIKVENTEHLTSLIQQSGDQDISIKLTRKGESISTNIRPIIAKDDNEYKLGLWVRDSTAGIGTLTFYQPETGNFGGLGHGITDVDTGELLKLGHGSIVKTNILSVRKGKKGNPGELKGIFMRQYDEIGSIKENCEFGIFGTLVDKESINASGKAMPVATRNNVREGKAFILSNISEDKVEKFEIEIQKVIKQKDMGSKGMIIKITDKRLLNETGGIVQGMSGSPIIQNGKLIGAVTHVFVNDPTKGYGIFIDWMLNKALNM